MNILNFPFFFFTNLDSLKLQREPILPQSALSIPSQANPSLPPTHTGIPVHSQKTHVIQGAHGTVPPTPLE